MAQSYASLHPVDQILTNLAIESIPSDVQLIGDKIFESIDVSSVGRTGTILVENSRNFMGAQSGITAERAPGASRARLNGFDRSSITFACKPFGFEDGIAMEDIYDSQFPQGEEQRLSKKVGRALKLAREQRAASLMFTAGNWSNSTLANLNNGSTGTQWNQAGAEPLTDLHVLMDVVRASNHGIKPDSLILGYGAIRALARNPEIRGIFLATSGAASGERILQNQAVIEVLKAHLGISNIYVGDARVETAVAGLASSEADIWTASTVWMGSLRGSDAIQQQGGVKMAPLAAANFSFMPLYAGQYDSLDKTTRNVWAEMIDQDKIIDSNMGYCLTSCLA
jgi:hypothetical protein